MEDAHICVDNGMEMAGPKNNGNNQKEKASFNSPPVEPGGKLNLVDGEFEDYEVKDKNKKP